MVSPACQRPRAAPDLPCPVVDRASLETMLQISRRSAIRLLHAVWRLPGRPHVFDSPRGSDCGARTRAKRRDVFVRGPAPGSGGRGLGRTCREWRARQVKLPVAAEPRQAASLPAGLRIVRAGVLEVEFATEENCWGDCMNWCGSLGRIWKRLPRCWAGPSQRHEKMSTCL